MIERFSPPGHASRSGWTLIELLIVIGICGLLLSLLLPAVQSSREAARRLQCSNNIKQIGMATHLYLTKYGVYPSPNGFTATPGTPGRPEWMYSLFSRVLTDLDQARLFDSINFAVPLADPYAIPTTDDRNARNATAMSRALNVLLCPADGPSDPGAWTGGTNYRANLGTERWWVSTDGPFSQVLSGLSPAAIRDGSGNTAGFSEKLRGHVHTDKIAPRTDMIVGPAGGSSAIEARLACQRGRPLPIKSFSATGLTWMVGTLGQANYNHTLEPNSTIPDCACPKTNANCGLVGARSNHPGGVNVGFMDGSVRFLSQTIQLEAWRALGSRSGGEVLGSIDD